MKNFTYIICYRHQEERYLNLIKVIDYLRSNFKNIEIILVEQDVDTKIKDTSIFDKYIHSYSKRPFNRSWAFNVGAKYSTADILFFGDCDLICPKNQINKTIELLSTYGCVSPYNKVLDLDPTESTLVDLNKWTNISRRGRGGTNLTGGIVAFNKSEFYKISGWCEDFEGWGGEDDFQTWKVINWIKHKEVSGNVYHLYHKRATIDQSVYQNNLNILKSISNTDPKKLISWINSSKESIGNKDKYVILTDETKYKTYLKNKRVIIVGPSPDIIGSSQKEFIESFDIIVRMNKSIPINPNRVSDIGERTDIYYHCMSQLPENGGVIDKKYLKDKIKFISSPYPNIPPFNRDISVFNNQNKSELPFHIIDKKLYDKISIEMNTRPNTGVCAIIDLLSYDIKELHVTGFSFFKGGYDPTYRNQSEEDVMNLINRYKVHNVDSQKEYFKKLYQLDDRLNISNDLKKILDES